MRNPATTLLIYLCLTTTLPVMAQSHGYPFADTATGLSVTSGAAHQTFLFLAEAEQDQESGPESGTLVIPGEEQDKKTKQCLNVCKKWGEDCIINPRTGSRSCRRTCKQFGEECF